MIFKTLVLSLVSLVSSQPAPVDSGDVFDNTAFRNDDNGAPFANCAAITDCFTCVLNGCIYKANACSGNLSQTPKISDFFTNSQSCPDSAQFCTKTQVPKDGKKILFDELVYSFDPKSAGKQIPRGYFCVQTYQVSDPKVFPILAWDRSKVNGVDGESLLIRNKYADPTSNQTGTQFLND